MKNVIVSREHLFVSYKTIILGDIMNEEMIKTENIKEENIFCVPGIVSSEQSIEKELCDIKDVKTENIFCFTGIQKSETCEDLVIKEEYEETKITGDPINITDDQIDIKEEEI